MSDRGRDGATIGVDERAGARRSGLVLRVVGEGVYAVHELPSEGELLIGRAEEADISIDDPSVSRRHAILRIGRTLTIEDLGSANGTIVGGKRLREEELVELEPGEAIELGTMLLIIQRPITVHRAKRLWSHGYFEGRIEEECTRGEELGASFAVARFHVTAAKPQSTIEAALAAALRPIDVLASYGPREYEALLLDVSPTRASSLVREVCAKLDEAGVGVEYGLACFPTDGRTPEALIGAACAGVRTASRAASPPKVILEDHAMKQLYRMLERVAVGEIAVLLLGETGAGKEVIAESVHRMSRRAAGPFLRLNCAALSESLLESELFGHERGAFTGAAEAKPGLLESASGGTVFLDELGEIPLSTQVKLLRVIEERRALRVGGLEPRAIDVRFIAATNRNLEEMIARGTFRQDLYYRLSGFSLVIPPLRERTSEIEPLARAFIAETSRAMNLASIPRLSADAREVLLAHRWPGNIRELRNVIERAVLLCEGDEIRPEHLPLEKLGRVIAPAQRTRAVSTEPRRQLHEEVDDIERQRILDALERNGGNQSRAARELGIARSTLVTRLEAYGIPRPRKGR